MTEQKRAQLRILILQALDESHPLKLSPAGVFLCASQVMPAATLADVVAELHDLLDEKLVDRESDAFNAALVQWRRTEKGRALLASKNLNVR